LIIHKNSKTVSQSKNFLKGLEHGEDLNEKKTLKKNAPSETILPLCPNYPKWICRGGKMCKLNISHMTIDMLKNLE
jgi:hypothetical protein